MAKAQGTCDPKFAEVRSLLEEAVASGKEIGASVTVNIGGKNVVDIWGGYTSKNKTALWERDTIVNVFSCTKTIASLAVLMLVDRGLIDVDEKVSKYWPEFGTNGKGNTRVRHLLSHTSGLSSWQDTIEPEDLANTEKVTSMLAQQAPFWEPGNASGYHALTFGYPLGELVRRVTGKSFKEFVATEMAGPLGADFQIGALEKDWNRIGVLKSPVAEPTEFEPGPEAAQTFTNPLLPPRLTRTSWWKGAEVGAANGHTNSNGLARMLSPVTCGGQVDGIKILSPETIEKIFQEQSSSNDLVLGVPVRYGIGFGLSGGPLTDSFLPPGKISFWGGYGGSLAIMDVERGMTITYVMNRMESKLMGNEMGIKYVQAIYAALANPKSQL
jgi:CubicO group peptidase (beta-lactamase class C family)